MGSFRGELRAAQVRRHRCIGGVSDRASFTID